MDTRQSDRIRQAAERAGLKAIRAKEDQRQPTLFDELLRELQPDLFEDEDADPAEVTHG